VFFMLKCLCSVSVCSLYSNGGVSKWCVSVFDGCVCYSLFFALCV